MFNKDEYFASPAITLPFQAETIDFTLTKLEGECARCGKPVVDLRGRITEHPGSGCLDIRFGGVCNPCRTLTPFRIRWYPDQKRILQMGSRGWVEYKTHPDGWVNRAQELFHELFQKIGFGQK